MDLYWNEKNELTIQIQNLISNMDCRSKSNPLNWIAIRIEQFSNIIQHYPRNENLHIWFNLFFITDDILFLHNSRYVFRFSFFCHECNSFKNTMLKLKLLVPLWFWLFKQEMLAHSFINSKGKYHILHIYVNPKDSNM